jgi:hypothetical protein
MWTRLLSELKGDKSEAVKALHDATVTLWGAAVPPKSEWTDEDVAQLSKTLFDVAF